jgi:hypothetical protein
MGREILRLRMLAIKNRVAPSKGGLVTARRRVKGVRRSGVDSSHDWNMRACVLSRVPK